MPDTFHWWLLCAILPNADVSDLPFAKSPIGLEQRERHALLKGSVLVRTQRQLQQTEWGKCGVSEPTATGESRLRRAYLYLLHSNFAL